MLTAPLRFVAGWPELVFLGFFRVALLRVVWRIPDARISWNAQYTTYFPDTFPHLSFLCGYCLMPVALLCRRDSGFFRHACTYDCGFD